MPLLVVLPVYHNEQDLPELLRRLRETCAGLTDMDAELVFVDDSLSDRSFALMVMVLVHVRVQLVVSGVIGAYLWRVLEEVRPRPPFVIAAAHNVEPIPASRPRPVAVRRETNIR